MVVWTQYLQNVADFLNTTSTQAGIISSLAITIGLLVTVLIATRGKDAIVSIPSTAFFCSIFFLYIGWFPQFIGSVIALISAIFLGFAITRIGVS